ncbi:hypothetical protein GCM10022630_40990 [Thermobifida alba]
MGGRVMLDPMIGALWRERRRTSNATACPPRAPATTHLPPRAAGEPLGHEVSRHDVEYGVDSVGSRRPRLLDDAGRAVEDLVGARPAYRFECGAAADREHPCAAGPGKLHEGQAHAPRGTGHHDGVARADPAALGACPAPCRTRWAGRRAGRRRAASGGPGR